MTALYVKLTPEQYADLRARAREERRTMKAVVVAALWPKEVPDREKQSPGKTLDFVSAT